MKAALIRIDGPANIVIQRRSTMLGWREQRLTGAAAVAWLKAHPSSKPITKP